MSKTCNEYYTRLHQYTPLLYVYTYICIIIYYIQVNSAEHAKKFSASKRSESGVSRNSSGARFKRYIYIHLVVECHDDRWGSIVSRSLVRGKVESASDTKSRTLPWEDVCVSRKSSSDFTPDAFLELFAQNFFFLRNICRASFKKRRKFGSYFCAYRPLGNAEQCVLKAARAKWLEFTYI